MNLTEIRTARVGEALDRVRGLVGNGAVERAALEEALIILRGLADQPELWSAEDFPPPDQDARQARYLISEDPDKSFALYLNVMQPGRVIPPHNHTTWACIAGVEGEEENTVYTRTDDGSVPGRATIEVERVVRVGVGSGIALLPDDIHSVVIGGDIPIRHLHMYGRALETLDERLTFDIEAGTCKPMPIGVQTKR